MKRRISLYEYYEEQAIIANCCACGKDLREEEIFETLYGEWLCKQCINPKI